MKKSKLLPCPKCRSEHISEGTVGFANCSMYYIACDACGIALQGLSAGNLYTSWNTRADVISPPLDLQEIELVCLPKTFKIHVADKEMNWQEAVDYAESIGMRLPTKFELQVIAESTDEFSHLEWCWSSSSQSNTTTNAWNVNLDNGNTNYNLKTNSNSVLCLSP